MTREIDQARENAAKTFDEMATRHYQNADRLKEGGKLSEAEEERKRAEGLKQNADHTRKNIGK